ETQVHARRADMEQQVARRRDGVMDAVDLAEGVEFARARGAEQPVPGLRAEAGDARQAAVQIAETDGAHDRRQVRAQGADGLNALSAFIECRDQEYRRAREIVG